MNEAPLVSIVIPCFNREKYVAEAIESALKQTYGATEIIVVDDGSADRSFEVASSYERVRAFRQVNQGESVARNTGLAEAKGSLVLFLDDDDRLLENAVESHVAGFRELPEACFVYGSNRMINAAGEVIGVNDQKKRSVGQREVLFGTVPSPSQCMFRKEAVLASGCFDPTVKMGADFELYLRMTRDQPAYCHGAYVVDYRIHPGQATKQPSRGLTDMLRSIEMNRVRQADDGAFWDKAKSRWKVYYGQFIPSEIAKCMLRGDSRRALAAARTYFRYLPFTAKGTVSFLSKRVGGRLRKA